MKPNWTPIRVKLGELIAWEDNPKLSTKEDARRLIESEKEFGQPIPFSVSPFVEGQRVNCYDGHQRLFAWRTVYGDDFEIWAMQSDRHLTDAERRRFVLRVHNAHGQWSWDSLSNWGADELQDGWFNSDTLKGWKADVTALGEFLKSEQPTQDAEPETDRAAELLEKWQVKPGDMFAIGEHRLICGDCTDAATVARVMGGEKAQMCFTSPPYNAGVSAKLRGNTSIDDNLYKDEYDDNQTEGDYLGLLRRFTDLALSNCDYVFVNIQVLSGNKHAFLDYWHGYSDKFCDVAVWDKSHAAPQQALRVMDSRFEFVLIFGGNGSRAIGTREFRGMVHNVYTGSPQRHNENADIHAATFPIDLPDHFIKTFTNEGELIYEPFCGTGTTLAACENLGRRGRACELSPSYVAVALERMSTAFPDLSIHRIE